MENERLTNLGFWGAIVQPKVNFSVTPPADRVLKISSASLDTKATEKTKASLLVVDPAARQEFVICTLNAAHPSAHLDLFFIPGGKTTFKVVGDASIHLTGYTTQIEGMMGEDSDLDTELPPGEIKSIVNQLAAQQQLPDVEDEDDDEDGLPAAPAAPKPGQKAAQAKQAKPQAKQDGKGKQEIKAKPDAKPTLGASPGGGEDEESDEEDIDEKEIAEFAAAAREKLAAGGLGDLSDDDDDDDFEPPSGQPSAQKRELGGAGGDGPAAKKQKMQQGGKKQKGKQQGQQKPAQSPQNKPQGQPKGSPQNKPQGQKPGASPQGQGKGKGHGKGKKHKQQGNRPQTPAKHGLPKAGTPDSGKKGGKGKAPK